MIHIIKMNIEIIIVRPPQKWEFSFNIQFQNFQKPKMKLKKDPLKFQKIKNIYKDASNQKVL